MQSLSASALDRMVSRQVLRWAHREERQSSTQNPCCIAISRLPGSGAPEIGQRVADDLHFGFFGIELVDQIARAGHVHPSLVARLDERVRNAIDRFVRDGVRAGEYNERGYREGLMRVLGTFAERGMAVLLGRGAAFALPPERTLRVLVVASESFRVARLAAATGLEGEPALERLRYEDAQRHRFNQYYFDVNPDDAAHYDLVVNSDTLGIPAAANLVTRAFRGRFQESKSTAPKANTAFDSRATATF